MIIDFLLDDIRKAIAGLEDEVSGLTAESFAAVDYVSSAKTIYFYNAVDEEVGSIDTTDFVVDGMIDTVSISGNVLHFVFNTDAGKQPIDVDLSSVMPDLSAYWTSAETQSAITAVENHLFDVEEVTASALTELHDDILELSARTVDLSAYTPTANFATINGSAITNGGNIVIEGGGDMSDYWTSAETKTYVDSGITIVQDQIDTLDDVVSAALVDLNDRVDEISGSTPSVDLSGYYTSAQTEDAISYALIPYYTSAQTNTAISAATQDMVESTDVKHIVKLTQAEYDALTDKDPYTFYIIISNS